MYGIVANEPNPVVALVVETSKLVDPVIVIFPPPEVKVDADKVIGEAVEGPEPAT